MADGQYSLGPQSFDVRDSVCSERRWGTSFEF